MAPSNPLILSVALSSDAVSQVRMMLHFTSTSGSFTFQHVATADVALKWTAGPTCMFVASTMAGALGRSAP